MQGTGIEIVVNILYLLTIISALFALYKPYIGLYILVFVIPWHAYQFVEGLSIPNLAFPFVFLGVLLANKIKIYKHYLPYFAFFIWEVISIANAGFSKVGIIKTLSHINNFLLIVVLFSLINNKKILKLVGNTFILSVLFLAIIQIIAIFFPQSGLGFVSAGRAGIIGFFANRSSHYFAISIGLFWLMKTRNLIAFEGILNPFFVFPTLLLGVLASGSKSSMLAGILFYLILLTSKKYQTKKVIAYFFLILIAYISILFLNRFFPEIKQIRRLTEFTKDPRTATTGRSEIFKVNLEMFKHNWFFGVGIGMESQRFLEYVSYVNDYNFKLIPMDPHNTFMSVLIDLGIVGFVIFIIICLSAYKGGFKNPHKPPIEYFAYITTIIVVITSTTYLYSKVFWFLLGFTFLLRRELESDYIIKSE
jgi:O-antigen ligase